MSIIRSVQKIKTISRLDFFLNKQTPLFKPCFQPAPLPWQQHTP